MPQPRITTQRTPMFQGPKGTLAPMPARMSHDIAPRIHERPSIRAQKMRPLTTQARAPSAVITRNWSRVRALNASMTSS